MFEVYEGTPQQASKEATKGAFEAAIRQFRAGAFADAHAAFSALQVRAPDDRAVSLYVDRCREMMAHGLPDDWDGVVTLTSK